MDENKHIDKKKLRKYILLSPLYLILYFLFMLIYPIFYIIAEKWKEKLKYKITFIILYAVAILSFIFLPVLFWIMIGLIGAFAIWIVIYTIKDSCTVSTSLGGQERKERRAFGNIFDGLSFADAKTLYRKLIRKYHPDNPDGSVEYTKKITTDYEAYIKR